VFRSIVSFVGDEVLEAPSANTGAEQDDGGDQGTQNDAALAAVLESLDSRLADSQRLLGRQADLTDRLHAENQALRAGELRAAQAPLVRDLLRLHDDLSRMREAAGEGGDDLRVVQATLLDTLARNGVESFAPQPEEPFDAALHSAAGVETTDDASLDRTVAEVLKPGFRWDAGEVIRVAEVRAYRHSGGG
jgi:molecular chaperone GrpE (heat shock protein)